MAVCTGCAVEEECLAYLAYAVQGGLEGIYGATTTRERKAMRQAVA